MFFYLLIVSFHFFVLRTKHILILIHTLQLQSIHLRDTNNLHTLHIIFLCPSSLKRKTFRNVKKRFGPERFGYNVVLLYSNAGHKINNDYSFQPYVWISRLRHDEKCRSRKLSSSMRHDNNTKSSWNKQNERERERK